MIYVYKVSIEKLNGDNLKNLILILTQRLNYIHDIRIFFIQHKRIQAYVEMSTEFLLSSNNTSTFLQYCLIYRIWIECVIYQNKWIVLFNQSYALVASYASYSSEWDSTVSSDLSSNFSLGPSLPAVFFIFPTW